MRLGFIIWFPALAELGELSNIDFPMDVATH